MSLPQYFRIERNLGEGGFGTVVLATDTRSGHPVAVKILRQVDPDALQRFEREGRILQRQINNRFVVDILGGDLANDPPYLVLEYCPGGSLQSWISIRHSVVDVLIAVSQAVMGLHGIHAAGGFHRDIKPHNLLLGLDAHGKRIVKISDFGLARVPTSAASSMTRGPWGTPGYIAPEVLIGAPYQASSDVWSLGTTFLELLTGHRDIAAISRTPGIPKRIQELLLAMLHINPLQRPDLSRVSHELKTALSPQRLIPSKQPAQNDIGLGELLAGGVAIVGLLKLLGSNSPQWDKEVQRYRDSSGRFSS